MTRIQDAVESARQDTNIISLSLLNSPLSAGVESGPDQDHDSPVSLLQLRGGVGRLRAGILGAVHGGGGEARQGLQEHHLRHPPRPRQVPRRRVRLG